MPIQGTVPASLPPFKPSKFQWTDLLSFELRELIRQNSRLTESELATTIAAWLSSKLVEHISQGLLTAAQNWSSSSDELETLDITKLHSGAIVTPSSDTTTSARERPMLVSSEMVLPVGHSLLRTPA